MTQVPHLDILLTAPDTNRVIIAIDNFIGALCGYGDDYSRLTEPQKQFYLNQNLEREVNNGGFNQYFCNSSGDHAHETVVSLQAIGADKTARVLQKAIDEFPDKKVPKDRDEREAVVEQIESEANKIWESLNEQFFKYEDDLNALNILYIKQHKDLF